MATAGAPPSAAEGFPGQNAWMPEQHLPVSVPVVGALGPRHLCTGQPLGDTAEVGRNLPELIALAKRDRGAIMGPHGALPAFKRELPQLRPVPIVDPDVGFVGVAALNGDAHVVRRHMGIPEITR